MKRFRFISFFVTLSLFTFISTMVYAQIKLRPLLSMGYGNLSVSNIAAGVSDPASYGYESPEAYDGKPWNFFEVGFGIALNSAKTQIYLDVSYSKKKKVGSYTRPLLGGGVTHITSYIGHFGIFLGLRQKIISRLFVNAGIGLFSQGDSKTYSPAVATGNKGGSVDVGAWYWGPYIKLTKNIFIGAKIYETFGEPSPDNVSLDDPYTNNVDEHFEINGTVFQLTVLFEVNLK